MVKKIVIVSLAVVAGLVLLGKTTHLGSYVHTAWNQVRSGASNSVPMEFEIQRLKDEIAQLGPDMRGQIKAIADEIVAVENLRKDVGEQRVAVGNQRDALVALKKEVASGTKTVSFKGREYTTDKAKEKLQRDFEGYKRAESSLKSKEALLEAKENALAAARDNLAGMRSKKEELEVAVAQLEAELKTLRVAQTKSTIQLDDSRLARIKESVSALQNRIKSEVVSHDLERQFNEGIDATASKKTQSAELLKEIDEHLGTTEVDVTADNK